MRTYISGRSQDQFIRLAVIEGHTAYVPPGLFAKMRETAIDPTIIEMQRAAEQCRWLQLRSDEWTLAKLRGLTLVVDYEMEDIAQ